MFACKKSQKDMTKMLIENFKIDLNYRFNYEYDEFEIEKYDLYAEESKYRS